MYLLPSSVQAFTIVNVSATKIHWMKNVFCGNSPLVKKENIIKDSQASNFHAIMPPFTCVSSTEHDRLLSYKWMFLQLENDGR
jgi:hypothetical protein